MQGIESAKEGKNCNDSNAIKLTKVEQMVPAYTVPVSLCIVICFVKKTVTVLNYRLHMRILCVNVNKLYKVITCYNLKYKQY